MQTSTVQVSKSDKNVYVIFDVMGDL